MYHAIEDGWGLESDSIESFRFNQEGIWNQLRRDIESAGTCKLSTQTDIFLGTPVLWGGTSTRIQVVSSYAGKVVVNPSCLVSFAFLATWHWINLFYFLVPENLGIFDAGLLELLTHVSIVRVVFSWNVSTDVFPRSVPLRVVMTTHDLVIE